MKSNHLIFFCILIQLVFYACEKPEKVKQPNLLFILTDEQRFDTSAPYGNHNIITPNLNKLGENGIVFKNAYVTQAVCSPSRASILTGLYPHTNGVFTNNIDLPENAKTLPELVNDTDYKTAYIGKWHLGKELDAWHGFQTRISSEDGYTGEDTTRFSDYHHWLVENGYSPDNEKTKSFSRNFASELPFEFSKTKFIENKAIQYLDSVGENPFMLYLSFLEPHSPNNGPFNDLHDTSMVELDSSYFQTPSNELPLRDFMENRYRYKEGVKKEFAKYWGLVHQVDKSVGAVLDKLKTLGIDDNTIVVFTSEHGKMLMKYGFTGKVRMNEEAARIPWMMKVPNFESRIVEGRVGHIDLVPTLLDLMGQEVPQALQGKSLVHAMKGEPVNHPVFLEWTPFIQWDKMLRFCPDWAEKEDCVQALKTHIRTIVTQDGWKLNWSTSDKSQLFNLNNDPLELNNLYGDKEYEGKIEGLKELIKKWQEETSDTLQFLPL
ncbi:sulfatase family protein [Flexithrix dorotheae]|uniref:sulfatase family protein n=1 Tax=Flexithrix dorotheae TaxID=70993 RepID=UPI000380F0DE|nr:sulfatase-like hydrolase/transferase [Flexithrix dorotheae]